MIHWNEEYVIKTDNSFAGYLIFIFLNFIILSQMYTQVLSIKDRLFLTCFIVNYKHIGFPCPTPYLWVNTIKAREKSPTSYMSSWHFICEGWRTTNFPYLYTVDRQSSSWPLVEACVGCSNQSLVLRGFLRFDFCPTHVWFGS